MKAMNYPFATRYPLRQVSLVTLTIALSCIAGASGAVYHSPIPLLLAATGICLMAAFVIWLKNPVWALYATLVAVFLPTGILPAAWQANVNRGMTVVAFGVWLLAVICYRRRVTITGTAWWMLAFIVWSLATLIWAEDFGVAWIGIQTYVLRLVLFLILIANEVRARKQLDGLMGTLALCGWILVVSSAVVIASEGYSPGERLYVFGMNENSTGILALLTMVGILWSGTRMHDRPRTAARIAGFVFIGLALVVTATSGSRWKCAFVCHCACRLLGMAPDARLGNTWPGPFPGGHRVCAIYLRHPICPLRSGTRRYAPRKS